LPDEPAVPSAELVDTDADLAPGVDIWELGSIFSEIMDSGAVSRISLSPFTSVQLELQVTGRFDRSNENFIVRSQIGIIISLKFKF
jgi:hypothetical protein